MTAVSDPHVWQRDQLVAVLMALALTAAMVSGGSIAFCGIGGGLLVYGFELARQRRLVPLSPVVLGFGLSFLALIWLADLTALAPDRSWDTNWRLMSIVLPLMLWFQHPAQEYSVPQWLLRIVPWVMLAIMSLLLLDFYTRGKILLPLLSRKPGHLVDYNRGLSYAAVLIWPLAYWLEQSGRRRMAAGLAAALLLVAWCSPSRGAVLAVAMGITFWLLGRRSPRLGVVAGCILLMIAAVGSLAIVPWLFENHPEWLKLMPHSWRHRFEIWDYLLAWHWPSPWLGWGTDVAAIAPLSVGHQALYKFAVAPGQHPHHAFLQLWLELGILGWAWAVALAIYLLRQLRKMQTVQRAAGLAAWAAFLTLASGSFDLWTDSFFAAAALALVGMQCSAVPYSSSDVAADGREGHTQVLADGSGPVRAPNTSF